MREISLRDKGTILVGCPLVCQLLVSLALVLLLSQLYNEIAEEHSARQFVSQLHVFLLDVGQEVLRISITPQSPDGEAQRIQRVAHQFASRLDSLVAASDIDSRQPSIDKVRQSIEALNRLGAVAVTERQKGYEYWRDAKMRYHVLLLNAVRKLGSDVSAVIADQEHRRASSPTRSLATRRLVELTLAASLVASICLALALSWWYAVGIVRPLSRIGDNSRLLAAEQPLLEQLPGDSELAVLDRRLHEIAAKLTATLSSERALLQNAGDMIVTLDKGGRVIQCNPQAQRLLDPKATPVGSLLSDYVAAEERETLQAELSAALASTQTRRRNVSIVTGNAAMRSARLSYFGGFEHDTVFCIIHDVTAAREAARIRDELSLLASAELALPLTAMARRLANICREAESGDTQVVAQLHSAQKNVSLLSQLVEEMTEIQYLQSATLKLSPGRHELRKIIEDAVQLVSAAARAKSISITSQLTSIAMEGDHQRLLQLFVNLLSNAIKFSPVNGTILVLTADDGQRAEVRITDSGSGVKPEQAEQIFQPFERLQPASHKGTGLGLTICKLIVDAHGGAISVAGSTFTVLLPKSSTACRSPAPLQG